MQHRLIPYDTSWRRSWDDVVSGSRNGHFMFHRDYLEYHGDRIEDRSYLLLRGNKGVALLPAHRKDDTLASHRGLSFGGWVFSQACLHKDIEAGFALLGEEIRRQGWRRLEYAPAPYPYHEGPCGDDLFLLEKLGARSEPRALSAFLVNPREMKRTAEFRRRLRRGEEICPFRMEETEDVEGFWDRLCLFLDRRHGAQPVHTAAEIRLLRDRFPGNIRFFVAQGSNDPVAGLVLFLSRQVVRLQYIFRLAEEQGAEITFRLWEWVAQHPELSRPWLDLGTSMEPGSTKLMASLHRNKEMFGARGVFLSRWIWEP